MAIASKVKIIYVYFLISDTIGWIKSCLIYRLIR